MITDKYFYYWYIWIIVTVITVTVILLWVSSRGCTRCKLPLNPLLYVYMLQQLKYILRQGGWYFQHLLNPDNKRNNTLLRCCLHFFLLKSCSDRYCYHDNCTGFLQLSCAKSSFQVTDVVQLEPCMQWVATNILCTNTDAFQHWPDPRTYQGIQQWACCYGYYVSNKYTWVSKCPMYTSSLFHFAYIWVALPRVSSMQKKWILLDQVQWPPVHTGLHQPQSWAEESIRTRKSELSISC